MKKIISLILTALMLAGAAVAVFSAEESPFSDVKETRWSYEAIKYAVKMGYMNGVGDGKFDPAGSMTRGMVVTVLYRREGSPEVTFRDDFTDVKAGKYYSDAVIWAKDEGVVNGITETTFEPNGKITREQLATMLSRFSERCLVSVPERADLSGYPDADKIHSYAKDALAWANEANLIKGMSDGTLSPRGEATREQFATILQRFDDTFNLVYNEPALRSHFTEPEYPLVENADVYVALDGSDEDDGSFDHPVATFDRAVEKVREIKAVRSEGNIVVAFKAGNYGPLSVALTAEDSGSADQRIVYCKYGDGDVVFDNGTTVTEDEFVPLDEADKAFFNSQYADRIRKADVTGRLDTFSIADLVLSDNGEMTPARFPNRYPDGTDHLQQGGRTVDDHHIAIWHQLLKNRLRKYHSQDGIYLYGYITLGWYKDLIETDGFELDPDTGDYVFYVPHPENTRGGKLRSPEDEGFVYDFYQMAIVNVSEELDYAGEYWLDRDAGALYVYEPSGDYIFPGGGDMITMEHADYISFVGLTLKNTLTSMIAAEHSHEIILDGCHFSGGGAHEAVFFRFCDPGRPFNITVRNSEFSFTAATALEVNIGYDLDQVRDTDALFTSSDGVLIDNNLFTRTSLTTGNCGAVAVHVFGPTVSHNEFRRCYWEGIDFRGSVNMTAEYNVFDQVCCNGDDTGMVNNWYSRDRNGNVVRHNLFMASSGGSFNGAFALYLDDTTGTSVYSNIFYNTAVTAMNNGICTYNTFCDNLIVKPDNDEGTGCDYRTGGTEAVLNAMADNDDPSVLTSVGEYRKWVSILSLFAEHPEYVEKAGDRWDWFFGMTTDVTLWDTPEFCLNNSLIITGNREINATGAEPEYNELIRRYSTIEDNVSYRSEENPLLVNPTIGDYRLREGVEGFPDFEFEKIGRY